MHLSRLLTFSTMDVTGVVSWIILPFLGVWILAASMWHLSPKMAPRYGRFDVTDPSALEVIENRVDRWFRFWLVLTLIEIIFSGGVPLIWLLRGAAKNYTKFGLPFVHVFAGSLLGILATTKVGLYLLHGNRRRLIIPAFSILWGG